MLAVVCRELGAAIPLEMADLPVPELGACHVRIAVQAAGVNFADTLMVAGRYQEKPHLPFTPGLEVAGVIDAVGAAVSGFEIGQRVLALVDKGGFAQKVVARVDDVVLLPDAVDATTAAGFAIAYGTAHGGLAWRAELHAGERLLIHGAAGGVGLTAVECGKAMGAEIVATARGEDRLALARAHGADHVLDSERPDLVERLRELVGPEGFDVVFDPVGGKLFEASLRCIAWEGRIIIVGFASGTVPQIPANRLLVKNASAMGFYWGSYRRRDPARLRASFHTLFRWLGEGRIRPHVSHRLPLAQANEALDLLRARKSTGKVVLEV